jgi:hypothetical protein
MRVLLDECLPRRLGRELIGHNVRTVPEAGWAGKKNGELLTLARTQFDVLLTIDRGIPYQQDVARSGLAIIALVARSNRLADLQPLVPAALEALSTIQTGEFRRIG